MSTYFKNYSNDFEKTDVLIIGGGISGLTASYKILSKAPALRVVVVDANKNVGGEAFGRSHPIENWAMENQDHILKLCKELNVSVNKKYALSPHLKKYWEIGRCNFLAKFELKRFIKEIDVKSQQYRPGNYKIEKNHKTVEKYICSKLFFEESRNFIRFFVKLLSGVHSKLIPLPQFMSLCWSFGGLTTYIKLSTGCDPTICEIDTEELLKRLGDRASIAFTERKITEILHYNNYVIVHDENGDSFYTSVVILAMPWIDIMQIKIYPPIPPELQISVDRDQRFLLTSFAATYNDGYWRKRGFSGYLLNHNFQITGYEIKPTVYGGVILHDGDMQDILKEVILEKLSDSFGEEMLLPKSWVEYTFEKDFYLNLPLTTPWNRIIFASNNAATVFRGHISGAVQSGLRAGLHALLFLRPQNVQWQDLDEIQKASVIYPRLNYFQLATCSLNLYNSIFYIFIASILMSIFTNRDKLIKLVWKSKVL